MSEQHATDYWTYDEANIQVHNSVERIPDADKLNTAYKGGQTTKMASHNSRYTRDEYIAKYCVQGIDGEYYYKEGLPIDFKQLLLTDTESKGPSYS